MPVDKNQASLIELGHLIAEASRNTVFVVGAGLSKPAGLPDWPQLCDRLKNAAANHLEADAIDMTADEKNDAHERLRAPADLWIFGDYVRSLLKPQRYEAVVRDALAVKAHDVPPTYRAIWNLGTSGVISFNLDRCAGIALEGTVDQIATPFEESRFQRFLLRREPFLLQPHGRLDDPKTWVLGAEMRNRLLRLVAYRRFIGAVLSSRRLIVTGLRPKDFAFESLLLDDFRERLDSEHGVSHFWITPVLKAEDREWAKLYALQPIEYTPSPGHPEVLEILQHLTEFEPREPTAPPAYEGVRLSLNELPPDEALRTEPPEDIRRKLNAAILDAVAGLAADEQVAKLTGVLQQYSASVRLAWLIRPASQYAIVCGYRALDRLGDGAFSVVWKVVDVVDGATYAMKLMHEAITSEPQMFEAFRRGVQANRILAKHGAPGIVRFVRAFDIPAAMLMEYVEGLTLHQAMEGSQLTTLSEAVGIVQRVGEIVLQGHQLPERVLHRDLKPSNVMVRHSRNLEAVRDVVVLDFDLSWYEGALGKSAIPGPRLHNYIAPEQIATGKKRFSSRHTAVDVFGIGMLLYYVATGEDPELNIQNTSGFRDGTAAKIRARWRSEFAGVADYLTYLIEASSVSDQSKRVSLPSLIDGMKLIVECEDSGILRSPSDLLLIELGYSLDPDLWRVDASDVHVGRLNAGSKVSGATIEMVLDSGVRAGLTVLLHYSEEGARKRKNVARYLKSRSEQAASRLRRDGVLGDVRSESSEGTAHVVGRIPGGEMTATDIRAVSRAVGEAAGLLALEEG